MKKLLLITTALAVGFAGPAHADPVTAVVAWVGSTLAAGGAAAFALKFAASFALNAIAGKLLGRQQQGSLANVNFDVQMADDLPLSFVLGEYATAGKRKYIGSWGRNTRFITEVIEISAMPQGLNGLWVNDERGEFRTGYRGQIVEAAGGVDNIADIQEITGTPDPARDLGVPLANLGVTEDVTDARIWVKVVEGNVSAADPFLRYVFGDDEDYPWTADHIGRGKTYVIVTTQYDEETLNQYPTFLWEPTPLPVYDWRYDSTVGGDGPQRWGDRSTYEPRVNPAVIAYNVARGISYGAINEWVFGGKNVAAWRLPLAEWTAAANACAQNVPIAGGGTEVRYRCGLEVSVDMEPASVLEEIGTAANMKFAEVGGRLKPIVDLPGAAVFSFTDDDILITEGQSFSPFYPASDTFNAITATYPERGEKWVSKDAPEFINAVALENDGGEYRPTSMTYGAVPFHRQVQRLMRSQMRDFRRMRRHQFHLPPDAYALEPGIDMVSWTSSRNGYVNKQFMVESVSKTPGMNVLVSLREVDPSDYDWSSDFERPVVITPPVNPQPFVQPIRGFSVVATAVTGPDGEARRPAILAACDGDETGVNRIQIQVRRTGTTNNVIDTTRPFNEPYQWYLLNVLPMTTYEVHARLLSDLTPRSAWSGWLTVTTLDVRLGSNDLRYDEISQEVREDLQDLTDWMDDTGNVIRDVFDEIDAVRDLAADQDLGNLLARDSLRRDLVVQVGNARSSFNEQIDIVVGALGVQATRTTSLTAEFNNTTAMFSDQIDVIVTDQIAIVQRAVELAAELGEARAEYTELIDVVASDLTSAVAVTTQLRADFNGNVATTTQNLLALSDADTALAAQINDVEASIDDAVGTATNALISRVEDTEDGLAAQSDAITEVTARTNRGTASGLMRVTSESAPSGVQVRLGFRAEVNGTDFTHDAGFFVEANSNGTSQFLVAADRMAVVTGQGPTATRLVPFVVDGDTVWMQNAIVRTLSIGEDQVTVPVVGDSSTTVQLSVVDDEIALVSCSFTRVGAPTLILITVQIAGSLDEAIASFRLYRNGTQIEEWPGASAAGGTQTAVAFSHQDRQLGVGATTYQLRAARFITGTYTGQPVIEGRTITALHVKR